MRIIKKLSFVFAGVLVALTSCAVPVTVRSLGAAPAAETPPALAGTNPSKPAEFITRDLTTSTAECNLGSDVWVSVNVTNVGGQSGTYPVVLKVGGVVSKTQDVTLDAGASRIVWFVLNQATDLPALVPTYTVSVDDLQQTVMVL